MKQIKRVLFYVLTLFILAGLALVVLNQATRKVRAATTITVTSGGDGGAGTLRQAVLDSIDGDTIQFAAGLTQVTLTSTQILLNKSLTITGPGANVLTVSRSSATAFRIFQVGATKTLNISGLTISGGSDATTGGGGIFNLGTLTLSNCTLAGNHASINGGGISNNPGATLMLNTCTISDNTANARGGGVFNQSGNLTISNCTLSGNQATNAGGGGIANQGTLTITNSTLTGNQVNPGPFGGGGILNEAGNLTVNNCTIASNTAIRGGGISINGAIMVTLSNCTITGNQATGGDGGGIASNATLTLNNCTIASNTATNGGGISIISGTLTLNSSIVANNTAPTVGSDINGTVAAGDYNLVKNISGISGSLPGTHNLTGIDPLLGVLANYGGPTQTMGLGIGSPAIDQGMNFTIATTDQRGTGFSRTFDDPAISNASGGDGSDIGAFERQASNPSTLAISAAVVSRQQGSLVSNSTIANVSDLNQPFNTLNVTVNGGASATANGVTVSGISVAATGVVTANVVANCAATNAGFTLTVINNVAATANATVTVAVSANTPPDVGTYADTFMLSGGSVTVTPSFVPGDNGSVSSVTAAASPAGFTGSFSGNTGTGAVTINNANPPGNYTITVTVTDNCNATTTRTFMVTVHAPITFTVTNGNDSGAGSLRQAVLDASDGDIIQFAAGLTQVTLTTAQILLNKSLTIAGPGANVLTVSRSSATQFRIFQVSSDKTLNISGLTISGGRITDDNGGGIGNSGTLTLSNCTISGNTAIRNSSGGSGGGINNSSGATLTINNCTMANNTAGDAGGGIFNDFGTITVTSSTISGSGGGGFYNLGGDLTLNNSTIANNFGGGGVNSGLLKVNNSTITGNQTARGAGIFNESDSILMVNNSTIANNSASMNAGGIYNLSANASLTLNSSIVANNTAPTGPDILGAVNSGDYNLVRNPSGSLPGTHNITGQDPLLGTLQNNGGPTQTRALQTGSPAIDKGKNFTALQTDQRGTGFLRIYDDPAVTNPAGGDGSDIGAFEVQLTISVVAVSRQQGSPVSNSTIANVSDPNQPLNTLTVTVNGAASATVNGVTVSGISVDASGVVTANVVANCAATNATFTLTVTNNAAATANTALTVTVSANTAPNVGTYADTIISTGGGATVTPSVAPGDNGSVSTVTAAASPAGFTGSFSGNTGTGAVTISNANPPGTYTITVTVTDNCNATTTRTFMLTVRIPILVVTNGNNSGTGSLRQAVLDALDGDTIQFAAGLTQVTLTNGQITLDKNLTIIGPGANVLTVSRSSATAFGIFAVSSGKTVSISGLTISGGSNGIFNQGTLMLSNCTISGNQANLGGGVANQGTLTITNSTISGNQASSDGGGIFNQGTLTLNNSTISGNQSIISSGGGIANQGGTLTLNNSTISGNSAPSHGGGIYNFSGPLTLNGSIVAINPDFSAPDISGAVTAGDYNLVQRTSEITGSLPGTHNITGQDPLLGTLQNNGGPTQTRALQAGSPAIDKGKNFAMTFTDQRGSGFPRTIDDPTSPNPAGGDGSDIGAFEVQSSTAIQLVSFSATNFESGTLLEWRTGLEVSNLGFRLYRNLHGKLQLLTPQLLAGSALKAGADLQSGESYAWWDTAADNSASYWLEDIDLAGQSTWRGPFYSTRGDTTPSRAQTVPLADLSQSSSAAVATHRVKSAPAMLRPVAAQLTNQRSLAGRPAVKIGIRRDGWYRLTQAELLQAGLAKDVDARLLQLYVDGREIPILINPGTDGRFDESASIEFYGVGIDTPSTDIRTYWLTVGQQPGKRITQAKGEGVSALSQSYTQTIECRDRTIYFAALRNGESENFFGAVVAYQGVDQTLTATHLASPSEVPPTLEVALQGVTLIAHRILVQLNGFSVGYIEFNGQQQGIEKFTLSAANLHEGANTVRLISQNGTSDISLVDHIRLSYPHMYLADDDTLQFSAVGNQRFTLDGFTSTAIRVIDVTDADNPQELLGDISATKNGAQITIAPTERGERTLLALTDEQIKTPLRLLLNQKSNWRNETNAADMVILSQRSFFPALEPLRVARESEGLRVAVVDIEDLYDEFNFGVKSVQAVRDFFTYAKSKWKQAPRFALLVGDASYDPKNYLGLGDNDLLPTKLLDTDYLETASDDWLADVNNDGVADLAIGRLPARTLEDATQIVQKIIAYDRAKPSNSILLVADRNEGFDFVQLNQQLHDLLPATLKAKEINRSNTGDEQTRREILAALNGGAKLVNYVGHGSVSNWNGNLLTVTDANALSNRKQLSLFVMMNCLNGYFHEATRDSLAEALLKAEGGAIAVWASSGLTMPQQQAAMNQALYRALFDEKTRAVTLGEAVAKAKASTNNQDIRRSWVLLGDPTTRLR